MNEELLLQGSNHGWERSLAMRGWTRESVGTLDLPVESYCAAQLDIDKSIVNILPFFLHLALFV